MSWHPMVIAAAKELNKRVADSCNVNADDQWALEGDIFISDADAMLKAAGAIDLLEALQRLFANYADGGSCLDPDSPAINQARKAIAKATGEKPSQYQQFLRIRAEIEGRP